MICQQGRYPTRKVRPMVSEELIAEVSGVIRRKLTELDSNGWEFDVVDRGPRPGLSVEFNHPLLPYSFSNSIDAEELDTASTQIASWMQDNEEFQLVALSNGVIRDESVPLMKGLRGALVHPQVVRAVESVGWLLVERGILTRHEMDWLAHSFTGEWACERQRVSQAWIVRHAQDES